MCLDIVRRQFGNLFRASRGLSGFFKSLCMLQLDQNPRYTLLASGLQTGGNDPNWHNRRVGMFRDQ